MKTFVKKIIKLITIFVIISNYSTGNAADNRTAFLNIEMTDQSVKLINSEIKNCDIKWSRCQKTVEAGYYYQVVDHNGSILFFQSLVAPFINHYDGIDEQGEFHGNIMRNKKVALSIKIPYSNAVSYVDFYFCPDAHTKRSNHRFLGSVHIRNLSLAKSSNDLPEGIEVRKIVDNGADNKRINLAILAEGFTVAEKEDFFSHAARYSKGIMNCSPYNEYNAFFNTYAIFVPSEESGSDHPSNGIYKNTYFNSTFYSIGISAIFMNIPPHKYNNNPSFGVTRVYNILNKYVPDYDMILLLVNDEQPGGCAKDWSIAISTIHSNWGVKIGIHELGHTFAKLADEYFFENGIPSFPERANSTRETNRDKIKWNEWILPSTPIPTPDNYTWGAVGLFEGCNYAKRGWYRPQEVCKMRGFGSPAFCKVCRESHIKSIYQKLSPIEFSEPEASEVLLSSRDSASFKVKLMQPESHGFEVQWILNDTVLVENVDNIKIKGENLLSQNELKVVVTDTTDFIKDTAVLPLLTDSALWHITLNNQVQVENGPSLVPSGFQLYPCYPNPFNPSTTIKYHLSQSNHVTLTLFNLSGQEIETLVNGFQTSGKYEVTWQAKGLPSGIYFCRLQAGEPSAGSGQRFSEVKKLILQK